MQYDTCRGTKKSFQCFLLFLQAMWTTLGYESFKQKRELAEHIGDAQGTGCQVVKNLPAGLLVWSVEAYTKESNLMRPYIFKIVTISYHNGTYSFFHLSFAIFAGLHVIKCFLILFSLVIRFQLQPLYQCFPLARFIWY